MDFQEIGQAYSVLSNSNQRKEYDLMRSEQSHRPEQSARASKSNSNEREKQWTEMPPGGFPAADAQFDDIFEEMLREETNNINQQSGTGKGFFWGVMGGISGSVLGFILANIPGAIAGGVAGNRLGSVRDKHKKPVLEVFKSLPQSEKAQILAEMTVKLMAQMASGKP